MTLRQRATSCCSSLILVFTCLAPSLTLSQTPPEAPVPTVAPQATEQPASTTSKDVPPELQGDLLAVRQRYLDAIEAYRKAPQSAVVANKIGVAYHHMFDLTDAKKNYEIAIKLDPHYAEAYNNLGAIYHAQKDYRDAQHYYHKALKLSPNSPLFYTNLGTAYFFQGNSKKGAEAYRQAFALDPEVFERGNSAKIEESSSTKDMATVNYVLAKTYAQAGMNDRALLYLRKAIAEGFNDRRRLLTDRELASLRDRPEFQQLLTIQRAQ